MCCQWLTASPPIKIYTDRLYKDLLAASQFPDWNPRNFLDVGEMTYAFAIGYDWLFDVWTSRQKQVIKQAIMEKGLLRAMLFYEKLVPPKATGVHFPTTTSNWNSVCNGGITVGALAIADVEPLLANEIIKNAVKSVPILPLMVTFLYALPLFHVSHRSKSEWRMK